jgi:putative inorganic carbon (hco3(-)) transporter
VLDWAYAGAGALWLSGLAALLACAAAAGYTYAGDSRGARDALMASAWPRLAVALVCLGGLAGSHGLVEPLAWLALALGVIVDWLSRRGALPAVPRLLKPKRAPTEEPKPGALTWLTRRQALWLALASPVYLFPRAFWAPALLLVPALWLARRAARGRCMPRTPLDAPLASMLGMALVSLVITPNLAGSIPRVTTLLLGVGLFYALADLPAAPGVIGPALRWFALTGGALAVAGLLGANWASKVPALAQVAAHVPGVLRGLSNARGGFNPNEVGGALLLTLPLQAALTFLAWRRPSMAGGSRVWRAAFTVALAVTLITLTLTQSRSALTGLLLAAAVAAWLAWRRARLQLAVALLLGLGLLAALAPQYLTPDNPVDPPSQSALTSLHTLHTRTEIWALAVDVIRDFPLTGTGMGAFDQVTPALYPGVAAAQEANLDQAHNQFLQAALDLGLPGLIGYGAVWLLAFALSIDLWRRARGATARAVAGALLATLLASVVFGLTDTVVLVSKGGIFFWPLLGLLVASWQTTGEAPAAPGAPATPVAEAGVGPEAAPAGPRAASARS